ncbi:MAG: FAD-dependent oxidoreductase [Pyrodictiaceae archaeon]
MPFYDLVVVGAGVVGLYVAYTAATRTELSVAVVEALDKPGLGVSSRSANVIHVLQPPFNSLKSRLCLEGNRLYRVYAEELGFRLIETKAILAARGLQGRLAAWMVSRILGRILPRDFKVYYASGGILHDIEPMLSDDVSAGVVVEGYAIVDYKDLIDRLANGFRRHGELYLGEEVKSIRRDGEELVVETSTEEHRAKIVVNSGGLYADEVARRAGDPYYTVRPIKGVMSLHSRPRLRTIVAPLELRRGETKGGGAIPQASGMLLLGPNNAGYTVKDDYSYTASDLEWLRARFQPLLSQEISSVEKVVVGLRPTTPQRDFVIEWSPSGKRVIHLIGIESPGLTAAPAIAYRVLGMMEERGYVKGLREPGP